MPPKRRPTKPLLTETQQARVRELFGDARHLARWSMERLAAEAGIGRPTINRILNQVHRRKDLFMLKQMLFLMIGANQAVGPLYEEFRQLIAPHIADPRDESRDMSVPAAVVDLWGEVPCRWADDWHTRKPILQVDGKPEDLDSNNFALEVGRGVPVSGFNPRDVVFIRRVNQIVTADSTAADLIEIFGHTILAAINKKVVTLGVLTRTDTALRFDSQLSDIHLAINGQNSLNVIGIAYRLERKL